MVKTRYIGSGREREGGFAATHKQDFVAHVTGGDWRHIAEHIDMSPPLSAPLNASEVQSTLEKIGGAFLDHTTSTGFRHTADQIDMNPPLSLYPAPNIQSTLELMATGQGFITIGDGYMTGFPKPDLYDAFQWAFAQTRIANKGGIIVVKAGEYVLRRTVNVPKGFTIWGEPGGSRIVSEVTTGPAFNFEFAEDRDNIGTGMDSDVSTRMSRLWNISLFDNRGGNVSSGGPSAPGNPIILLQEGAEVLMENVTLIGRFNGSAVTSSAVSVAPNTGATPANTPTILRMTQCYIDAVSTVVDFTPNLRPDIAELHIDKCRARTFSLSANQFFVQGTIGKLFLNNNYHLGVTPTGFNNPSGFLAVVAPNISGVEVSFVSLIGNKGGLNVIDNPSLNTSLSRQRFIVDLRATKPTFRFIDVGNNWGAVNSNPWYITVGDGINSMGDFTGQNALEQVSNLFAGNETHLNSRSEQIVILNPGSYSVNTKLKVTKLFGNSIVSESYGSTRKVIVYLNSTDQIVSSGVYDNFVGQAANIEFIANVNAQRISSNLDDPQLDSIFKNCVFTNCTVYIENNGKAIVDGCKFNQNGQFQDLVSLVLTTDDTSIVDKCVFNGFGYALFQSSWNAEAYLTNCLFDPMNDGNDGYSAGGTNRIRNIDPLYAQSKYIILGRFTQNVYVDKVWVKSTPLLIANTMLGTYSSHIELTSDGSLNVQNSRFFGPDQIYNDTFAIVTCEVSSQESLIFNNNQVVGAMPLQVSDFSMSTGSTMGSRLNIVGNEIRHYEWTGNPVTTALSLDLNNAGGLTFLNCPPLTFDGYEGYDGYDGYVPSVTNEEGYDGYDGYVAPPYIDFEGQMPFAAINIAKNRIIGFLKRDGKKPVNIYNSWYTAIGLLQVYAPGWSVKITDNDIIYAGDDKPLHYSIASASAAVVHNAGGFFRYSSTHIKNNTISHRNDGYYGQALNSLLLVTDLANIQGNNFLSWHCGVTGDGYIDGYQRRFVDIYALRSGNLIIGNTFNSNNKGGITEPIYSQLGGDGYGIIIGNWFDVDSSVGLLQGNTSQWIVSNENYGLFDFS